MADSRLRASTSGELERTLSRLESVWDDIGLTEEQREERRQHFYGHIVNLCEKIVDDETTLKNRISSSIERSTKNILSLYNELNIEPETVEEGLTLLELDAALQEQEQKLQEIKAQRMEELQNAREKDEGLCELLCETPFYLPSALVPSPEDIASIKQHITSMEKEKEKREEKFKTLKRGILQFLELLEQTPDDSFTQEVIYSNEDEFSLGKTFLQQLQSVHSDLEFKVNENEAKSQELREKIEKLWTLLEVSEVEQEAFLATAPKYTPSSIAKLEEELERLKVLRLQNLSVFVEKVKEELEAIWDKCYVGDHEREVFTAQYTDHLSEEVLGAYEKELETWSKYHSENQEILGLIGEFLKVFRRMLELEERAKDPSRLFNTRGGALLQEEKAKKQVKNDLPRVQEQLEEKGRLWAKDHGRPLMVLGQELEDYIESLWMSYDAKKETEKKTKQVKSGPEVRRGVGGGALSTRTPLPSSSIKTPLPVPLPSSGVKPQSSAKKRRCDEVDSGSPKRPRRLPFTGKPSVSPLKFAKRSPVKTPRTRPLTERNAPLPPSITVTSASDESILHSTISYEKFEADIKKHCHGEVMHSSVVVQESPLPRIRFCPVVDVLRESRLRETLHLASPAKQQYGRRQIPSGNDKPTLPFGSLRRVASQPCINNKPGLGIAGGLQSTRRPLTTNSVVGKKIHPKVDSHM